MCNYKTIKLKGCRPWKRQTRLFFFSSSFCVQQEQDRFSPPEYMELIHSIHRHSLTIAPPEYLPLRTVFQNK